MLYKKEFSFSFFVAEVLSLRYFKNLLHKHRQKSKIF